MLEREAPHLGEDAADEFEFEEEVAASPNPKLVWEGEEGQREREGVPPPQTKNQFGEKVRGRENDPSFPSPNPQSLPPTVHFFHFFDYSFGTIWVSCSPPPLPSPTRVRRTFCPLWSCVTQKNLFSPKWALRFQGFGFFFCCFLFFDVFVVFLWCFLGGGVFFESRCSFF